MDEAKLSPPEPVVAEAVSWTICCVDGATFSVAVPEDAPVAALKRAIGVLREMPCSTMEVFEKDVADALADARPLRSLNRAPLFLLPKPAPDRLALEALFESCGGADWGAFFRRGWLTDVALGEWEGVTIKKPAAKKAAKKEESSSSEESSDEEPTTSSCSGYTHGNSSEEEEESDEESEGRVIALNLNQRNLAGPFPSEIQQLSFLRELDLDDNQLAGPIPTWLGQLGTLRRLSVFENRFTGPIPSELRQLQALTHLDLGHNLLTGPIPAELGQLSALQSLSLTRNLLTGLIPAELRQLGALHELYLGAHDHLTGQEALREYMEENNPDCTLEL
jgi:hypothetical protein